MKRTNKIKAYLARVLAAAMVITMAAPPAPRLRRRRMH